MRVVLSFFMLVSCIASCKQREFGSSDALTKYIRDPDNGYTQSEEINGMKIVLTYRPTDLLVLQDLGEDVTDIKAINSARKKYNNYFYFVLSLSMGEQEALTPANGMEQYSDMVQTLSYRMAEYVTMTTSASDTIPVGDFMLNRTFGLSRSTDILFVFNREMSKNQDWVQFNLNEFGLNTGNQRFRFNVDDLENAPQLKFR